MKTEVVTTKQKNKPKRNVEHDKRDNRSKKN